MSYTAVAAPLLCIDVESIGLHGEGFAVGFVVIDEIGAELECGLFSCSPASASGFESDRQWVRENVPTMEITHDSPREVRRAFWACWRHWADRGSVMMADCGWPVEARFLSACVDDIGQDAAFQGPYPLLDVATLRAFARKVGVDVEIPRLSTELPIHHPTSDARYSARVWRELAKRVMLD
jgi:hypothetical protein